MPRYERNSNHRSGSRTTYRLIGFGLAFLLAAFGLTMTGCGKSAGGNSLHLKSPATGEKDLVRSSYAFTVPAFPRLSKASLFVVYAANYDLNPSHFALSMDKPLTSDDQLRIEFNLGGEAKADDESPPKAGIYSADAAEFMKVETVIIYSRKDGTESRTVLNRNSQLTGEVKLTSVSSDTISGEVNLSSSETSIKGSFTAKILKSKQRTQLWPSKNPATNSIRM